MSKRGYENYGNYDPAPKRAAMSQSTSFQRLLRPVQGLADDNVQNIMSFAREFHAERVDPTMANIKRAVAMLPYAKDPQSALDTLTRRAITNNGDDGHDVVRFLAADEYKTKFDILKIMNTIQAEHSFVNSGESSIFSPVLLEKLLYIFRGSISENNVNGFRFMIDALLGADTDPTRFASVVRAVKRTVPRAFPFPLLNFTTGRPGRLFEKLHPANVAILLRENIISEDIVKYYAYRHNIQRDQLNTNGAIRQINKKIDKWRPKYLKHSTYTAKDIQLLSDLADIYLDKQSGPRPKPAAPFGVVPQTDRLYSPPCWNCNGRGCFECRCRDCGTIQYDNRICGLCDSEDPYFD